MAINRLTIDGYASLELTRVSFPITGRVVADVPLASTFDATAPAEAGMILAVDYAADEVKLPSGADDSRVLGLHYSTEKEYDPANSGLKGYKLLARATNTYQGRQQGFDPRLGLLSVGEKITSNCICYDTGAFADNATALAALVAYKTTPVYGVPSTSGAIQIVATLAGTESVALQVIKSTTMPNGDIGVKFVVIKAQ